MKDSHNIGSVDDYIAEFSGEARDKLCEIREFIWNMVPEATEHISYGMPTFRKRKILIHYAAFKNHIGLYPGPGVIMAIKQELQNFGTSKGTIRFPLDKPLPFDLIEKIIRQRLVELAE